MVEAMKIILSTLRRCDVPRGMATATTRLTFYTPFTKQTNIIFYLHLLAYISCIHLCVVPKGINGERKHEHTYTHTL